MRPDQHKKKKNSEYKKKHGILSDKAKKSDKNESTTRHRSDELQPKSTEPKLRRESQEIDDDDDDIEPRNGNRERGFFSRRKMESNWDRYKNDFEDDFEVNNSPASASSAPVGADYQSLRDKAASSSSYFQFTSEKKWEHLNYDETNNKAGLPFMSINCHVLAQSLRNIPLERRLDIDKKYSVEEENHISNTRKTRVDKPVKNHHIYDQETTVINNGKFGQNVSSNSVNSSFSKCDKPTEASVKIQKQKEPVFPRSNMSNEEKIQHPSNELGNKTEKLQKNGNTLKTNEVDDFDLIVGFENQKEFNSPHKGGRTADQVPVSSTNEANITTELEPQSVQNTKEDLEDWLDSILD